MSLPITGEKPPTPKTVSSSQNVTKAASLQDLQTQKIARKTFEDGEIPSHRGFLPSVSVEMGSRTSPPPQRYEAVQRHVRNSSSFAPSFVSPGMGSRTAPEQKIGTEAPMPSFVQNEKKFSSVSVEMGSRTSPGSQRSEAPPYFAASSSSSSSPFASPFPPMQGMSTVNPAPCSFSLSPFTQREERSLSTISAEVGSRTSPGGERNASHTTGSRPRKRVGEN